MLKNKKPKTHRMWHVGLAHFGNETVVLASRSRPKEHQYNSQLMRSISGHAAARRYLKALPTRSLIIDACDHYSGLLFSVDLAMQVERVNSLKEFRRLANRQYKENYRIVVRNK